MEKKVGRMKEHRLGHLSLSYSMITGGTMDYFLSPISFLHPVPLKFTLINLLFLTLPEV